MKIKKAVQYVEESLSDIYCNSCKNNEIFDDDCDDCHRKYMMWGISHETAESIVSGIVKILESDWIPCSERLPENDESVLATTAWGDVTIAERVYPPINNTCWFIHDGNTNATTDDVVAWLPLPEPYLGDKDDFNNKRFDS